MQLYNPQFRPAYLRRAVYSCHPSWLHLFWMVGKCCTLGWLEQQAVVSWMSSREGCAFNTAAARTNLCLPLWQVPAEKSKASSGRNAEGMPPLAMLSARWLAGWLVSKAKGRYFRTV